MKTVEMPAILKLKYIKEHQKFEIKGEIKNQFLMALFMVIIALLLLFSYLYNIEIENDWMYGVFIFMSTLSLLFFIFSLVSFIRKLKFKIIETKLSKAENIKYLNLFFESQQLLVVSIDQEGAYLISSRVLNSDKIKEQVIIICQDNRLILNHYISNSLFLNTGMPRPNWGQFKNLNQRIQSFFTQ